MTRTKVEAGHPKEPEIGSLPSSLPDELPKAVDLNPAYQRVFETILVTEGFDTEYARLMDHLMIGVRRNDPATVLEALDRSEVDGRKAHSLFMTLKWDRTRWELENEKILAMMREKARKNLEIEKELERQKKTITEADVHARTVLLFPVQWRDYEQKRKTLELLEESLEQFVTANNSRPRTLQTIAMKQRGNDY